MLMSSLDMNVYFGQVADETLVQCSQAEHRAGAAALLMPELLDHSSSLDDFPEPIPDPFAGERIKHAKSGKRHVRFDRDLAKSAQIQAKSDRVEANSGKGHAKADSVLAKSDQSQGRSVNNGVEPIRVAANSDQECIKPECLLVNPHRMAFHTGTDLAQSQADSCLRSEGTAQVGDTALDALCNSTAMPPSSKATANTVPVLPSEDPKDEWQQPPRCVQKHAAAVHCSTADALPAGAQHRVCNQGENHISAASSWPEDACSHVAHMSKLRHGQQLRQAAAEAAAVAAAQAARAESAVHADTPPAIAFHSKAARHAMAASEAAAAAASLRGLVMGTSSSQEGLKQMLTGSETRAGRLHASAPASPFHPSKQHSSVLHKACHNVWTAVSRRTGCSTDSVDVCAPQYVADDQEGNGLYSNAEEAAAKPKTAASAPASPSSFQRAAAPAVPTQEQVQSQQSGAPSQGHHIRGLQANLQSRSSALPPDDDWQCLHAPQLGQRLQQRQEPQQECGESQLGSQHGSQLGSQSASQWLQQEEQDPFKASALFPVYAELPSSIGPFTDCTNQLSSTHHQTHQQAQVPRKSEPRHKGKLSKSAAAADTHTRIILDASAKARLGSTGQQVCSWSCCYYNTDSQTDPLSCRHSCCPD